MNAEHWNRILEVLEPAIELGINDRNVFLSRVCEGDEQLRKEIESILSCEEPSQVLLERPAALAFPDEFKIDPDPMHAGQIVGAYELLEKVASGGMGVVFRARRTDPDLQQDVAIKFIRHRVITPEMIRRFVQERQTLARLTDANIARLYDGGVTKNGLPYLVMEYIRGLPIDQYCDRERLSTRDRLILFQHVCSAVEFAHQNLIVHSDIKPSNILVTDRGAPKLLDFGVSRLLNADDDHVRTDTPVHQIMTPQFASPEQIRGDSVSTTSDVYSLGIVLFKLLTGRLPFSERLGDSGASKSSLALEKPSTAIFRDVEAPSRGSSYVSIDPDTIGRTRNEQPAKLRRRLEGDLDAITLKALSAAPADRYGSVAQLSSDIQRHLDDLPIIARRGTQRYCALKFLKRNRIAVGAVSAVVLALAFGTTIAGYQAAVAKREAQKAHLVKDFLQDMLSTADPTQSDRGDGTIKGMLERAEDRLMDGSLNAFPQEKSEIMTTLGRAYVELGLYDKAESHLSGALAARREILESPHPLLVESLNDVGRVFRLRGDHASSETHYRLAIDMCSELGIPTLTASTQNNLGVLLKRRSDFDEAESLLRKSVATRREVLGDTNKETAESLTNLAAVLKHQGKLDAAEQTYRESIEAFRRSVGERHYRVAVGLNNLALVLRERNALEEAVKIAHESLAIRRQVFGDRHPAIATGTHNLAMLLVDTGDFEQGERKYRDALALRRDLLGPRHPSVAITLNNLADLLVRQGHPHSAEPLIREALVIKQEKYSPSHPSIAGSRLVLGRILIALGRNSSAESEIREAISVLEDRLPAGHDRITQAYEVLRSCTGDDSIDLPTGRDLEND